MNTASIALILIVLVVIAVCAIVFLRRRLDGGSNRRLAAKPIFTKSGEQIFFRLCAALPACYIFPRVELAAIVGFQAGKTQRKHVELDDVFHKTMDFVVCDDDLTLVCVVNLSRSAIESPMERRVEKYCRKAGIKTIRWDADAVPTADQIRKIILPLFDLAKQKEGRGKREEIDTVLMMYRDDPEPSHIQGLTIATLDRLTPNKVLLNNYPHIWQRICVFAVEPKHLQKYLSALALQDRGDKRAGFPLEALTEIADIRMENDRFLQSSATGWQPGFINP